MYYPHKPSSVMSEPSLNTAGDAHRAAKITGKVEGWIQELFRHSEVEESLDRFNTAIAEEWSLVRAVATSGAHGWQIVSDDDGNPSHLSEDAYAEDVTGLVFENGWIYKQPGAWVHDPETVERVKEAHERRHDLSERMEEREEEVFEEAERIEEYEDMRGEPMSGVWTFQAGDTEYEGRPELVAAFRDGFEACECNDDQ